MKRKHPAQIAALNIAISNLLAARRMFEEAGEVMLAGRLATLAQDADIVAQLERVTAVCE